jgi:aldehyde:ferredoxin oxidoreductase
LFPSYPNGKDIGVACIGQAGENLVRFASVIFDKYSSAARGAGAVLGSKKLKAIVVRGTLEVPVHDPRKLKELASLDRQFFFTDPFQKDVVRVIGTHHGLANWFPGWHNNASYLSGEEVPESLQTTSWKTYELHRTGCHTCPAIAKDLYNRGFLSKEDTGGLDLSWENTEDQIRLIHLAHATSTRGADHLRGRSWTFGENDGELFPRLVEEGYLPSDEVERLIVSEDACALSDCIGRCKGSVNSWVNAVPLIWKYPLYEGLSKVLNAATGAPGFGRRGPAAGRISRHAGSVPFLAGM